MSKTLTLMEPNSYACLIGVEKRGLIWAGRVAERLSVPLVYYSLELYTSEFRPLIKERGGYLQFRRATDAEARYHRRAAATIVQTPERARLLAADTGAELSEANTFYVPVSLLGSARREPSTFLHDTLGLDRDQRLILYFGLIRTDRYALGLAEAAQRFHDGWTLVMHGWGPQDALDGIREVDNKDKVALSLEMVPWNRIGELIGSAAVGVALYAREPANNRLTAFASEKMALYMKHGVPFVAFDYEEYRQLAMGYRCGEVLSDVADLPDAVGTILGSHLAYRAQTAVAFADHYDFRRNFRPVLEGIKHLG
jgi:hypothetical protein